MTIISMMGYPSQTIGQLLLTDYETGATVLNWTLPADLANITEPSAGLYQADVGEISGQWRLRVYDADGELIFAGFASDTAPDLAGYPAWDRTTVAITLPALIQGQRRHFASTLEFVVKETGTFSFLVKDGAGDEVDFTGMSIALYFETSAKVAVAQVTSILINGATITFTVPTALTAAEIEEGIFSIRDANNGDTVVAKGIFNVRYAPSAPAA